MSHIQDKHIVADRICGKYNISRVAIVNFLVRDCAIEIVNQAAWHMNAMLLSAKKE